MRNKWGVGIVFIVIMICGILTPTNGQNDVLTIVAEYDQLIQSEKKPFEIIEFLDQWIDKLPPETADEMIKKLEVYQKFYRDIYTDQIFKQKWQMKLNEGFRHQIDYQDKNEVERIQDLDLKNLVLEILAGGYKFVNLEGSYCPIIDYEQLKRYQNYLSEDLGDYLELMAVESGELMSNDAALVISWDELANRVVMAEIFLKSHPNSPLTGVVFQAYTMYLQTYMSGMVNTPIFDWNSYQVLEEVLASYRKTIKEREGTITARLIQEYYVVLEKKGFVVIDHKYKVDDDVLNFVRDAMQKIEKIF